MDGRTLRVWVHGPTASARRFTAQSLAAASVMGLGTVTWSEDDGNRLAVDIRGGTDLAIRTTLDEACVEQGLLVGIDVMF